jgi:hypothetical protein
MYTIREEGGGLDPTYYNLAQRPAERMQEEEITMLPLADPSAEVLP